MRGREYAALKLEISNCKEFFSDSELRKEFVDGEEVLVRRFIILREIAPLNLMNEMKINGVTENLKKASEVSDYSEV